MSAAAFSAALVLTAGALVRRAAAANRLGAVRVRTGSLRPAPQAVGWVPDWFRRSLVSFGVADEPSVWWGTVCSGVVAMVVVAILAFGPGAVLVVLAAVATAPVLLIWLADQRTARRRAQALPVLLEDVARALRGGASLRQAIVGATGRADASLAPELRFVVSSVERGSPLVAELDRWSERNDSDDLRLAVAALALGATTGGRQARALDGVASTLRDRLAVDRELSALSSQAQASAVVMAVAPLCFAAFTMAVDRRSAAFLFGTATGLGCLIAGLLLDAIAAAWMLRLTGSAR